MRYKQHEYDADAEDTLVHLSSHAFTDSTLHQSTETRQHIDGRIHLPVVKLTVNVYLQAGSMVGNTVDQLPVCISSMPPGNTSLNAHW